MVPLLAGCVSTGLESSAPPVGSHSLTAGQVQAIVTAAEAHNTSKHKLSAGPMKAVKSADGKIQFCALVYMDQKNIFGTYNRFFFTGSFPSATSENVNLVRPGSDAFAMVADQDCQAKGISVTSHKKY